MWIFRMPTFFVWKLQCLNPNSFYPEWHPCESLGCQRFLGKNGKVCKYANIFWLLPRVVFMWIFRMPTFFCIKIVWTQMALPRVAWIWIFRMPTLFLWKLQGLHLNGFHPEWHSCESLGCQRFLHKNCNVWTQMVFTQMRPGGGGRQCEYDQDKAQPVCNWLEVFCKCNTAVWVWFSSCSTVNYWYACP